MASFMINFVLINKLHKISAVFSYQSAMRAFLALIGGTQNDTFYQ